MDERARIRNAASGEPVLHPAALAQLQELLGEDFDCVVGEFMTEAERLVAEAGVAAAEGDADTLGRAAHSLKSASATVGAQALSRLCAEVEDLANAGEVATAAALLPALAEEHQAATEAIRTLGAGS